MKAYTNVQYELQHAIGKVYSAAYLKLFTAYVKAVDFDPGCMHAESRKLTYNRARFPTLRNDLIPGIEPLITWSNE